MCVYFVHNCLQFLQLYSFTYATYKPSHRSHTIIPLSNHHTIIIPKSHNLRNIYMRRARFNHPSHGAALSHACCGDDDDDDRAKEHAKTSPFSKAKEEEMKRRISPKKTQQPSSVARGGDARSAVVLVLSMSCINADFALFLHTETS